MAASFTQDQLDKLEEAIAMGAKRVKYADKEVEYQSMREMLQARDIMRRSLGLTDSSAGRIYPITAKGLTGE